MKITICSSMRNRNEIKELLEIFKRNQIIAFFPNIDIKIPESGMTSKLMVKLQSDHFSKIKQSDIIYVITPDKYVGRMVSIEIGYAKALGKTVIFSRKTEQIELDVLADDFLDVKGFIRVQKNKT